MVMPYCGTFDYVAIVPDRSADGCFECLAQVREEIISSGDDLRDSRLVGVAPVFRITDAGVTPNPGPLRPRVMRSCITLTAPARRQATVAQASFHLDRAVTSSFRPGDVIHLARTGCGGLGLSAIRGGELVVAVGAVTAVPLGCEIEARIPRDLLVAAETIFRQRAPDFEFAELPIEFSVNGFHSVLYGGRPELGDFAVFVAHGFLQGVPGTAECAAISRRGLCPDDAANASALLLDCHDALSISRW